MLFEPGHTPFDLHFRIFGVQVRVHPFFWLISAALGWSMVRASVLPQQFLPFLALWIACVFVSILLHELGHVFMGQRFHSFGHIVLHGFGGLAIGSSNVRRRWQHIAVSAAGPAAQLILWGLLELLLWRVLVPEVQEHHWHVPKWARLGLAWMLYINLWWALLNLLPIWPLDGGQIARQVCSGLNPNRGLTISLWISILVAGGLAILEFAVDQGYLRIPYIYGDLYLAIFFALFAVNNIQELQMLRYKQRDGWEGSDW